MSLEGAVNDYTSGALEAYDRDDVAGLLKNHLDEARRDLEDARDRVKAVCELVEKPHDAPAYFKAFLGQENEGLRLKFYQFVSGLIRSYGDIAGELSEAGYSDTEIRDIQREVDHYAKARYEVKLASGDYIDLKSYEPAMRHLIDTYIRAERMPWRSYPRGKRIARKPSRRRSRITSTNSSSIKAHRPFVLREDVRPPRHSDRAAAQEKNRVQGLSQLDRGADQAGGAAGWGVGGLSRLPVDPRAQGALQQPRQQREARTESP